jgi:branched-chain amino acid transport system permease protein
VLQTIFILTIEGLGLNIFMGNCGQVNFGAAGFYALGAYACILLQVHLGLNYFSAFIPALIISALITYLVGRVLLRLRELSLAVGTVAFSMIIYALVESFLPVSFAGGSDGLSTPPIYVFGHRLNTVFGYYLVLFCLVIVLLICILLTSSRVGRAWHAIREDEIAASTSGINVSKYMSLAFLVNGVICSLGGVLLVQQTLWVAPSYFTIWVNVYILLVMVVGGMGSNWGMLVGAGIMVILTEIIMRVQTYPMIVYGIMLFFILRFLPEGIFPSAAGRLSKVFQFRDQTHIQKGE